LKEEGAFKKLVGIVARLRSPGGCPWDLEQTPLSLRGDLLEETYECIEAIDEHNPLHVKEELGDLFLLVTMLAYMHEQEGLFSLDSVLEGISEKLIRRHPHVFAENKTSLSSGEVLKNWAKIKIEQEGRKPKDSLLDEVKNGIPPLDRAFKLQKKAAKVGFDWPDAAGVVSKIKEELLEAENAAANASASDLEEELGDLLFSVINLCRFYDIEPSLSLQKANIKFLKRFKYMENCMKENGLEMNAENMELMDHYWNEAKKYFSYSSKG